MSTEEGSFGLLLAERFFGFILLIIGALAGYYTFTSFNDLEAFTWFFMFLSFIPLVLGVLLLLAKTE
jgi:hypothetical protein